MHEPHGSMTLPATAPGVKRSAPAPKLFGLMAEFTTPAAIYHAAEKVRDAGYRWWDCHVPFPVHGLDKAMGVRPTILPIIVFFGGMTGTILAVSMQILTNSTNVQLPFIFLNGYAFMVSGKPFISGPAFVPVAFELTVLLSALTAFAGMLVLNGLPKLYDPVFKSLKFARATDDRFFIVIQAGDPKFSHTKTEEFLRSLNAVSIEALDA